MYLYKYFIFYSIIVNSRVQLNFRNFKKLNFIGSILSIFSFNQKLLVVTTQLSWHSNIYYSEIRKQQLPKKHTFMLLGQCWYKEWRILIKQSEITCSSLQNIVYKWDQQKRWINLEGFIKVPIFVSGRAECEGSEHQGRGGSEGSEEEGCWEEGWYCHGVWYRVHHAAHGDGGGGEGDGDRCSRGHECLHFQTSDSTSQLWWQVYICWIHSMQWLCSLQGKSLE